MSEKYYIRIVSKIELKYFVSAKENNTKITKILTNKLKISNRLLIKLKMNQKILVNNIPVYSNHIVHENDLITVKIDFSEEDYILSEKMDLNILYEDDYLLAIDKPSGVVVHPSSYHQNGTLANGVKYYLNNNKKIRAINRLDRDTSGIVIFAKNEYIQELMNVHTNIKKEYLAIIDGILEKKAGIVNIPIGRKKGSIMEREVSEEGQIAITHYEILKEYLNEISLVKIILETGRTHQIRVHMAYLNTPVLGDTLYGNESLLIARQALHAYHVEFIHPITNLPIEIVAPIPYDMKKIIDI